MNKLIFKLFYSKNLLKVVFVFFIVFLVGCSQKITGSLIKNIPQEFSKNPEVYFCPKEDCGKIYESFIKSANFSVNCAFYDINLENVINGIAKKSKDIDVKLVMDSSNHKGQVKGNGLKMDDERQLMHNKFCIIDDSIVITGSFNPTENDNTKNNNNVIVVYSYTLAKNYKDEFNELWDGKFGKGRTVKHKNLYINNISTENYFCPEDKCASRIINLIKNAKQNIHFMAFTFTNEEIADALIIKSDLDIKGIFDSGQSSNKFSQFKRLQEFGIDVRKDVNKYKMHHKVFIIDNRTVVTGSFNPTLSADTRNDENLLVIHDEKIAKKFLEEFENLWS